MLVQSSRQRGRRSFRQLAFAPWNPRRTPRAREPADHWSRRSRTAWSGWLL